jgi:glycosyltransferase involved in cell wall biosynthesis
MRVAYLTTQYPKPSHTFIRREILALEKRGVEVVRLAIRRGESRPVDPVDQEEAERTIHCLDQSWWRIVLGVVREALAPIAWTRALALSLTMGGKSDRGRLRHLAYLAEACFFFGVLRRSRVSHVHVHFGTNAAAVARLIRCLGGPSYSFTVHGPDEFDAPVGLSLRAKIEDAHAVVAVSEFTAAQLRRWTDPSLWGRIHVVRCGLDDEFFGEPTPIPAESRTLVCVGRLTPQKGQLVLVEAMDLLRRRGVGARLVLVGEGELRRVLEGRVKELGLTDHVEFAGWCSDRGVREHLREARCLVLPSLAEGLPVVLMEAFALARPVVSTWIAGIPELVRPGENGWLVPAGSHQALADALEQVLGHPTEVLDRLGRTGRERVNAFHDVRLAAEQMEMIFRRAVGLDGEVTVTARAETCELGAGR